MMMMITSSEKVAHMDFKGNFYQQGKQALLSSGIKP
jgi:hypothetical protein